MEFKYIPTPFYQNDNICIFLMFFQRTLKETRKVQLTKIFEFYPLGPRVTSKIWDKRELWEDYLLPLVGWVTRRRRWRRGVVWSAQTQVHWDETHLLPQPVLPGQDLWHLHPQTGHSAVQNCWEELPGERSSCSHQTLPGPEGPPLPGEEGPLAPAPCRASWLHEACHRWHCHADLRGSVVHHPTAHFPDSPGQRGPPHRKPFLISDLRKANGK